MGKIRVATLGSSDEDKQRKRADARRQTKKSKKAKVEGVGLKGGERTVMMEGQELKPEFRKLVEEVEHEGEAQTGDEKKEKKVRKKKTKVRSRRYQEAIQLVDRTKYYILTEAVALAKKTSITKFDGTVELHVNLNPLVLGGKGDFRGSVSFPHATGKTVRVAIADDTLVAAVEAGKIDFDVLVAHPSMMPKLAKVARILGPKGLMPNPKSGTVTPEPEKVAESMSKGKTNFKSEPENPIVHMGVGKVSFDDKKLVENIQAVISAIGTSKISKVTIASTMGPGVKVAL